MWVTACTTPGRGVLGQITEPGLSAAYSFVRCGAESRAGRGGRKSPGPLPRWVRGWCGIQKVLLRALGQGLGEELHGGRVAGEGFISSE